MNILDIKELAKFSDQYVALSGDQTKILASNKSLESLQKELDNKNIEGVVIQYIPSINTVLSPVCL